MKFKININTPNSNYYNLDFYLNNYVFNYVSNFIKNTYNQNNIKYYLNINYKKFNYQNIISYVLYIDEYMGGAHPNNFIKTINYDTLSNSFITIDDIISKYPNILIEMQNKSRKNLKEKYPTLNTNDDSINNMFNQGTKAIKKNYSNFVFTNSGLKIFFNPYQIAPYSYGNFNIYL